jgi:hypothetical protein
MPLSRSSVSRWACRGAGLLFALAVAFFVAFVVFTYREEREAMRLGEPYDSIASGFLPLIGIAVFALFGAAGAALIWIVTRHRHDTTA